MDERTLKLFSKAEEAVLVLVALVIILVAFIGTLVLMTSLLAMLNGTDLTPVERANLALVKDYYRTTFTFIVFLSILIVLKELWTARKRLEVVARMRDLGELLQATREAAK